MKITFTVRAIFLTYYLESILKDIEEGNDHFEEHELIEVD